MDKQFEASRTSHDSGDRDYGGALGKVSYVCQPNGRYGFSFVAASGEIVAGGLVQFSLADEVIGKAIEAVRLPTSGSSFLDPHGDVPDLKNPQVAGRLPKLLLSVFPDHLRLTSHLAGSSDGTGFSVQTHVPLSEPSGAPDQGITVETFFYTWSRFLPAVAARGNCQKRSAKHYRQGQTFFTYDPYACPDGLLIEQRASHVWLPAKPLLLTPARLAEPSKVAEQNADTQQALLRGTEAAGTFSNQRDEGNAFITVEGGAIRGGAESAASVYSNPALAELHFTILAAQAPAFRHVLSRLAQPFCLEVRERTLLIGDGTIACAVELPEADFPPMDRPLNIVSAAPVVETTAWHLAKGIEFIWSAVPPTHTRVWDPDRGIAEPPVELVLPHAPDGKLRLSMSGPISDASTQVPISARSNDVAPSDRRCSLPLRKLRKVVPLDEKLTVELRFSSRAALITLTSAGATTRHLIAGR